jgi:Cytochrome c oxidase subunit IV
VAEELRVFVRGLGYLVVAGVAYWIASAEPTGTVLLVSIVLAIGALVLMLAGFARRLLRPTSPPRSLLGRLDRVIGFHEDPDEGSPPLAGGPDLVPLTSAWPILTAAAVALAGFGLVFGAWLLVPGVVLVGVALLGWLTQLDRVGDRRPRS